MRSAPVLLAAFFLTTVAVADEPAALQRLFPQQAEVHVERAGLSRLLLPPEVLAACSADLSDLRLFDDRDREVAFVVDRGPVDVEVTERFSPPVLDVRRSETGRRHAPTLRREQIEMFLNSDLNAFDSS